MNYTLLQISCSRHWEVGGRPFCAGTSHTLYQKIFHRSTWYTNDEDNENYEGETTWKAQDPLNAWWQCGFSGWQRLCTSAETSLYYIASWDKYFKQICSTHIIDSQGGSVSVHPLKYHCNVHPPKHHCIALAKHSLLWHRTSVIIQPLQCWLWQ